MFPNDATEIKGLIYTYGYDDWNPFFSINGQTIVNRRGQVPGCPAGGCCGNPNVNINVDNVLRPGANSVYVEVFEKHDASAMCFSIRGSYKT